MKQKEITLLTNEFDFRSKFQNIIEFRDYYDHLGVNDFWEFI